MQMAFQQVRTSLDKFLLCFRDTTVAMHESKIYMPFQLGVKRSFMIRMNICLEYLQLTITHSKHQVTKCSNSSPKRNEFVSLKFLITLLSYEHLENQLQLQIPSLGKLFPPIAVGADTFQLAPNFYLPSKQQRADYHESHVKKWRGGGVCKVSRKFNQPPPLLHYRRELSCFTSSKIVVEIIVSLKTRSISAFPFRSRKEQGEAQGVLPKCKLSLVATTTNCLTVL